MPPEEHLGETEFQAVRGAKFPAWFSLVAIGASAGGLAALKTLFSKTPAYSGIAYIVVVHLSPEHKSHLAELLRPHVSIPVQQVDGTVQLEPNRMYVIPPNANLDTIDTHLRLSPLEASRRERAPITSAIVAEQRRSFRIQHEHVPERLFPRRLRGKNSPRKSRQISSISSAFRSDSSHFAKIPGRK